MFILDWLLVHPIWSSLLLLSIGALLSLILMWKEYGFPNGNYSKMFIFIVFFLFSQALLNKRLGCDIFSPGVLLISAIITTLIATVLYMWLWWVALIWVLWSAGISYIASHIFKALDFGTD